MIWFVVAAIVALVGFVVFVCHEKEEIKGTKDAVWCLIPLFLLMQIAGVICALLFAAVSTAVVACNAETQWVLVETKEISALNDNITASGSFYLGSGRVDGEMKYFYVEETNKGKTVDSISADNVYIVESNTEKPRIEKWQEKWENESLVWLSLCDGTNVIEYKIYIPENSFTTDFNVDLGSGSIVPQNPATTAPSTVINHCAICGHALGAADKFCAACGTSIVEPTPTCPNCNTSCETPYCPACGTKVK